MLSERRLKKMRKVALEAAQQYPVDPWMFLMNCVLELTQELLDQRLLEQKQKQKQNSRKE